MVGVFNDSNEFPWCVIVSHKAPKNISMQAIKSLLEVNKIDVERSIPFNRLLNFYPKCGYLVDTGAVLPEKNNYNNKISQNSDIFKSQTEKTI